MKKILKEKINKFKIDEIAKQIDVSKPTIYRWLSLKNIENFIKFIQFLRYLEIDIDDFVDWYTKKDTE